MVEASQNPSHPTPAYTDRRAADYPWSRIAHAFLCILRARLILALNYWVEVLGSIIGQFVMMTVGLFLWTAAYGTRTEVAGMQKEQMLSFVVLSVLVGILFDARVHYTVVRRIKSGQIAADLMRPIPPLLLWLAQDLGNRTRSLRINACKAAPLKPSGQF